MKVSELRKGMLVVPAGDNEVFVRRGIGPHSRVPFISVHAQSAHWKMDEVVKTAGMYLGTRKDLNMTKHDFGWSNRYVFIDGEIVAVDPNSWIRMRKVI